ncbi:hypothetical protein C8R45DRAFT_922421 [Mycena sanguinolenta]|nr:hypothetical protein C8R45DRAFT_922421 [Mycena sanguinolenta]
MSNSQECARTSYTQMTVSSKIDFQPRHIYDMTRVDQDDDDHIVCCIVSNTDAKSLATLSGPEGREFIEAAKKESMGVSLRPFRVVEFSRAREWVATKMSFERNATLNTFEITTDCLAYNNSSTRWSFLRLPYVSLRERFNLSGESHKAIELGDRIIPVVKTPSGLPLTNVNLDFRVEQWILAGLTLLAVPKCNASKWSCHKLSRSLDDEVNLTAFASTSALRVECRVSMSQGSWLPIRSTDLGLRLDETFSSDTVLANTRRVGHQTVPYFYGMTARKNGYVPVPSTGSQHSSTVRGRDGTAHKRPPVTVRYA